jgi:hypothetical protein
MRADLIRVSGRRRYERTVAGLSTVVKQRFWIDEDTVRTRIRILGLRILIKLLCSCLFMDAGMCIEGLVVGPDANC